MGIHKLLKYTCSTHPVCTLSKSFYLSTKQIHCHGNKGQLLCLLYLLPDSCLLLRDTLSNLGFSFFGRLLILVGRWLSSKYDLGNSLLVICCSRWVWADAVTYKLNQYTSTLEANWLSSLLSLGRISKRTCWKNAPNLTELVPQPMFIDLEEVF